MSKASEYDLEFKLFVGKHSKSPIIISKTAEANTLADFIEGRGMKYTQQLIDKLIPLLNSNVNLGPDQYTIYAVGHPSYLDVLSPPPRVSFWTNSSDYEVPMQDFIDILHEWKAFLEGLPPDHNLVNR